jgi:hypothetical protein
MNTMLTKFAIANYFVAKSKLGVTVIVALILTLLLETLIEKSGFFKPYQSYFFLATNFLSITLFTLYSFMVILITSRNSD